jgi:hypothetical protein
MTLSGLFFSGGKGTVENYKWVGMMVMIYVNTYVASGKKDMI